MTLTINTHVAFYWYILIINVIYLPLSWTHLWQSCLLVLALFSLFFSQLDLLFAALWDQIKWRRESCEKFDPSWRSYIAKYIIRQSKLWKKPSLRSFQPCASQTMTRQCHLTIILLPPWLTCFFWSTNSTHGIVL